MVGPFAPLNAVMRGGSITGDPLFGDMVCATCFILLAEEQGVATGWRVHADRVNVSLETVTPSGRTWDEEIRLWVDSADITQASEIAALTATDREKALREALEQWKCPSCGGAKVYTQRNHSSAGIVSNEIPCKVCEQSGLHPIARDALTSETTHAT